MILYNFENKKRALLFFSCCILLVGVWIILYDKLMLDSDNIVHIEIARNLFHGGGEYIDQYPHILSYPLYHITIKLISVLTLGNYTCSAVMVLILSNLASIFIMRRILYHTLDKEPDETQKYIIDLISVAYIFFGVMAGYLTGGRFYEGQCSPNPWHNPTISFVRPLGLIAVYMFFLGLENNKKKYWILFSVFSVLSVLAKPSFMMVFLPCMILYILIDRIFIKKTVDLPSLFNRLVYPAIPLSVILFQLVYIRTVSDSETSVSLCFGSFYGLNLTGIIGACLATFPIPVFAFIFYKSKIFSNLYLRLSYMALFMGFLQMFFLTNGPSGDFSWGYDLAVGLSTAVVLVHTLVINDRKYKRLILFALFMYQCISGLIYIYKIIETGRYWF